MKSAIALAFALATALAGARASAAAATPETRTLAATLVQLGDERAHAAKALGSMERLLSAQIAMKLAVTDPSAAARVKQVVHDALSPVVLKADDAMVEGYAANFSADELGHVIAFAEGPEGRAEKANLPLLKTALAAALSGSADAANAGDAAARTFAAAPSEKRALVERILTAQDFEAHTRRGYATIEAVMKSAVARSGLQASAVQPGPEAEAKAADDYVKRVTEVEEAFWVSHYTDAQLAAVAAYLESEPGQAILTRLPKVRSAMSAVLASGLSVAIASLPERVCKTVACSPDQRASLAEFTTVIAASVSKLSVLTDAPG